MLGFAGIEILIPRFQRGWLKYAQLLENLLRPEQTSGASCRDKIAIHHRWLVLSRLLSFDYVDGRGKVTTRTVEPYQLILKNNHWHVQGYCHIRNEYRLFRLSRMTNLHLCKERFTPRDYQKPFLDIPESLETLPTEIKIRVHASALERVLDFCTYDHISPDSDEWYLVRFPFRESDFYYNVLLGFGTACECLEPPHIRAKMKHQAQRIVALYEGEARQ